MYRRVLTLSLRMTSSLLRPHISQLVFHISLPPTQGAQGTSRRPTHINIIDPAAQVSSPPPFRRGTGAPEAYDPKCIPLDSQMFWLFITRLRPTVTEENISTMACSRLSLNIADIIVRKLVKRDINCSTLSFVSFKVGLPASVQRGRLVTNHLAAGADLPRVHRQQDASRACTYSGWHSSGGFAAYHAAG